MNQVQIINIAGEYAGQRIDNYLIRELKGVPRSRIYRIIRKGEVRINGSRVKPAAKLKGGDVLRIPPLTLAHTPQARLPETKSITNTIIYEDNFVLIIDKPAGIAVHGGSGLSYGVIEALRLSKPENAYMELIHRLDRATSGCLMIAKKRSYLKQIQAALKARRELSKSYLVVVDGKWSKRRRLVNAPLIKNSLKSGERMTSVSTDGKDAMTEFDLLFRSEEYSLLRARPITGRTHQIRVHCHHAGCPVVGDQKYGDASRLLQLKQKGFQRMMLHAEKISLPDLGVDSPREFSAPLGGEMLRFVENHLGFSIKEAVRE